MKNVIKQLSTYRPRFERHSRNVIGGRRLEQGAGKPAGSFLIHIPGSSWRVRWSVLRIRKNMGW